MAAAGVKTPATADLLEAVAGEVARQLSNRHSSSASGLFTTEHMLGLLGAYLEAGYKEGERRVGFKVGG